MRVPVSWLLDHVELDPVDPRDIANRLTAAGLQVERVEAVGSDIANVVVGRVLAIEELTGHKKPIRWVGLTDGADERHVICGATNFAVGDLVAYARPPAVLPGGFEIAARKAYGHVSDGMICSGRELGISDDHDGILVLDAGLELGSDVVAALGLRDDVLDIAVNPDRGYALSVRGVAREVATAYAVDFRDPAELPLTATPGSGYPVRIDAADGCRRYVARGLTALRRDAASPAWLARRLVLAGMRPISLMVDVTNYVMLDLGQPLHAFDRDRLQGPIVVRWAAPGETLRTLDDIDRVLDPEDLVIADDSGPIALAGVMGGASTEIRDDTTDVVLEAASFDPVRVAYTSRRHRLGSEASRRFERGVDDGLCAAAAQAALDLVGKLGGGSGVPESTDLDLREPRAPIVIRADLPGTVAGVPYPAEAVVGRLRDVGCVVDVDGPALTVTPPSWRPDLRIPSDLVEEVVRLEGYAALPSLVPTAPAGRGLTRAQRLRRRIGRSLADAGFVEVLTTPFVDAGISERMLLDPDDPRRPSVRIANPVSDEEPFLRTSLLPGLFAAVSRNVGRGLTDIALFETGPVFRRGADLGTPPALPAGRRPSDDELTAIDAALPEQPGRVAAVLTGARERTGWWGPGRAASWADAIAAPVLLGDALGIEVRVSADRHAPFHPGRCAALHVGEVLLGHAGELHPRVVEANDLPPRTCAMEISLDVLVDAAPELAAAPAVSAYPPATIDIAVVVPDETPSADVAGALRDGAGELLEALRLFDVYEGDQVGAGRKSLAFTLRLRAPDRTLTAAEVSAVRDAAVAEAARRYGAELR
ncbi:MAG TPA: phenylalanine--tRNA ligase subunit beta [Mycobacteriales bacterium]|nr:phenylalanine--tRNA ligase subunit beta [Mycobacteriales bacterium]